MEAAMNELRARVRRSGFGKEVCQSSWGLLQRLYWLVALPFRLIAAAWRFAVGLGVGIVRFSIDCLAAAFGIALVVFIGYGLARALLHPLFRPN
jgi:hypothetical protein